MSEAIDFPRMTIPYRGDKYTGMSLKIFGQYVYELDRKVKGVPGKRFWTHTMPSTAAQQGIIPLAPETNISTAFPQMHRFAGLDGTYKAKFGDLANALSPENLHCDGEISHAQAQSKKKKLMAEWRKLEKEVGFPVMPEMLQ